MLVYTRTVDASTTMKHTSQSFCVCASLDLAMFVHIPTHLRHAGCRVAKRIKFTALAKKSREGDGSFGHRYDSALFHPYLLPVIDRCLSHIVAPFETNIVVHYPGSSETKEASQTPD